MEEEEQDCIYFNGEYTEIDNEWYLQSELDVIQIFIDNSMETINYDLDINFNGIIDPLELGLQQWHNGRLIYLNCHMYIEVLVKIEFFRNYQVQI